MLITQRGARQIDDRDKIYEINDIRGSRSRHPRRVYAVATGDATNDDDVDGRFRAGSASRRPGAPGAGHRHAIPGTRSECVTNAQHHPQLVAAHGRRRGHDGRAANREVTLRAVRQETGLGVHGSAF